MDAGQKIDIYVAKLSDPKIDTKAKANIATEVRDAIEGLCTPATTYQKFLSKLWPVFKKILEGEPVFTASSPDHMLRNQVLEILHRLHHGAPETESYAADMVEVLLDLIRVENEDNAVLCLKIISDLERQQATATAAQVQPFLDLIQEMSEMMEQVVRDTFDAPVPALPGAHASQTLQSPRPGSPATTISDSGDRKDQAPLAKGMYSFKVLAECPIIVVSIFQAHRGLVSTNVRRFVPSIKSILLLQAKAQERAHAEAAHNQTIFTGMSKEIKNRVAFGDFITAQVKTMSFLAYLLRVYSQQLSDFLPSLPTIAVRLLKDCPREKSSARKELLVAIRHIINFNYRKIFLPKIDDLLDERILIGDGLAVYETMRPLAYSTLADLIHHVRESLDRDQIRRTIEVYTRNLHDTFPGTSFQTMSAKLLLNMAERITKLESKADSRYFLIMILDAIGDKFAAMNHQYHNAVKLSRQYAEKSTDSHPDSYLAEKDHAPAWDCVDIFTATPIKTSNPRDRGADPVADNKFLFKNLVNGLKNLFFQLKMCNPSGMTLEPGITPLNWAEVSYGYDAEEVRVITKLFHEGARVFRYYQTEPTPPEVPHASQVEYLASHHMAQMSREEKELLESFGTVFHCIDPATFHEVFTTEIPHLHRLIFEHTALLHLPQFFLASEATSPAFAGMVLQYLMKRMPEVGSADQVQSAILLRLFKLSFMAVTLFSAQNEQVLHPHVTQIVTQCVQLSVTADEPMNFFVLLRSLFRSIGGGRFELLYKEILPLLEMLLETFNHLLLGARKPSERDLYVELTLTVPARLSHLLPHLSHLMRPLVVALRAGSDLVGQGLRTLELCVDNLTADYLDPIMAPIMDELMTALWEHLKPNPYSHFHAHTTMRILGKLGGRNRKFLNHPPRLAYRKTSDDEPSFDIRLVGTTQDRAFPLDTGVDLAIMKLAEVPRPTVPKASDTRYKEHAFHLLSTQLKLFIGSDHLPPDLASSLRRHANDLIAKRYDSYVHMLPVEERATSVQQRQDQEATLRKLLKACIVASTVPDLKATAASFVAGVCRHFTIVETGQALADAGRKMSEFNVAGGEGGIFLSTRVLADVLVECLASDNVQIREAADTALITIRDTAEVIFGSRDQVERLPFFSRLVHVFCLNCRELEWFTKAGATLGLQTVVSKLALGSAFLHAKQHDLLRALLFVIKDSPADLPASTRLTAAATIRDILRQCCPGATPDMLADEKSSLHTLCTTFVVELAHMSRHVRACAQEAFATMAAALGVDRHEVIAPVKTRLLGQIFNKPLRALPFLTQIGFIDAVSFLLKLGHGLVPFDDPLHRLLMESLALADADDEVLHPKPGEYNNAARIMDLRVACLQLLSTAMKSPDFATGPNNTSRARIIAVFFKSLYSKSSEIIDAANAGLREVLHQTNKLPKDLLQNGLRPILMNLQDPKRLTVAGLEGLARLLQLLTNYFKVEIGARLLEHMKVIADEPLLHRVSFGLVEQHPQMRIVAAILNIFHLLPNAAATFMADLVTGVLDLESKLRRTTFSPFRDPLYAYLRRYPDETWTFFQERLHEAPYGRLFGQLLADPSTHAIRDVVVAQSAAFVQTAFQSDEARTVAAATAGIHVVHSLSTRMKLSPWFTAQPDLKTHLLEAGQHLEGRLRHDRIPAHQRLRVEQSGDRLMDVVTAYLAETPDDLDFLFRLCEAAANGEIKTPLTLFQFLYDVVIQSDSVDRRRHIVQRSLDRYLQKTTPPKVKTFLLHYVVNPILAHDVQQSWVDGEVRSALMDKQMTDLVHHRLWKSPAADGDAESLQPGIDHARMEALQLSALLIKYHKDTIAEARKDIIKFAWSYIRLEDVINKYAAYVLISYFIWSYETPSKIAMQIYHALLKAHQNEGRALVTQALEIVAPILPHRLTPGDPRMPNWVRWPRRILAEETANLQQVQSIFGFIVRQPDLFFETRDHFLPMIVPALARIAAPPNPSNENKKLALSLVTLIWQWETKRLAPGAASPVPDESELSKKRDSTGSQVAVPKPPERSDYVVPVELRTAVIKYLVTFITTLQERFPVPAAEVLLKTQPKGPPPLSNEMCKKAVQLLRDLLALPVWCDTDVGLCEKALEPVLAGDKPDKPEEKYLTGLVNSLQVLRVLLSTKSAEWMVNHVDQIQKVLEKALKMEDAEIQDCLHAADPVEAESRLTPLLRQVLDAMPEQRPDDEDAMEMDSSPSDLVTWLAPLITDGLSAGNLVSSINTLWTLSRVRPAEVDQHIQPLMRVLQQKLAKDHLAAYVPPAGPPPPGYRPGDPHMDASEFATGVDLIKKTIDILSVRMSTLGEQRRPFLSVLASIVEKSLNADICNKVLDMVEAWVFDSNDSYPTLKEKTAVLHKMLLFEGRQDASLLKRFLELVIKIYEDPQITRTELTVRLEHAFLIGTRAKDVEMRTRFLTIFDRSLTRTASARLSYVLTSQNWDTLADSFWLKQAAQLIVGAVDLSTPARLDADDVRICAPSLLFRAGGVRGEQPRDEVVVDDRLEALVAAERKFNQEMAEVQVRDLLEPLTQLQHLDDQLAYDVWVKLFPLCWSALSRDERIELEKGMVTLLTREHHQRQLNMRPNVVQALLEGAVRARPRFKVPPHVMKFLSKTFDAWYTALVALEQATVDPLIDTPAVRESNLDALVETYAGLQEDDLFYGTWRRRCKFVESNAALSYEQHGIWDKAQQLYEAAQIKARTGVVPFAQGEYFIWEDHWLLCAQKLQQWDILSEFAKHENFNDLLLEAAWRNYEAWAGDTGREQLDSMIKSVSDAPTPRRTFFQAFMALLRYQSKTLSRPEFQHICDEATQLSIRKWHQLPKRITPAHLPVLQNFQQLVELNDASIICDSLNGTTDRNLDAKSQELKLLLQAWRDRLPNVWDDINAWQDLVTWRQHVFQLVNTTYLPLVPQTGGTATNNSYAFRGYHETAWIINKFAHVARKHQMPDVCITQLGKIYTLPNIEIQEAFLKLREQAKCHYQNPAELNNGLDVINNTNLSYFGAQQKAEFYTLKGMFLAKLQHQDDANEAFGVALYYDLRLPKAWAEWGQYSDRKFKDDPQNLELANNAVSCYLEAAGLYKSAKSRKMLSRVLWLLSLDDDDGHIAAAFEHFKGDTPVWYWTTFIPQLLTSLEHKEARIAKMVLLRIAKMYPQALFYQLRTTREELLGKKKQHDQRQAARQPPPSPAPGKSSSPHGGPSRPGTANGETATNGDAAEPKPKQEPAGEAPPTAPPHAGGSAEPAPPEALKKPWEYTDEINVSLKTAFPLLALSMETMTDQIQKHFKSPPDEDAYRLIVALLNDGLAFIGRAPHHYAQDKALPPSTEGNISKFAETVLPSHIRKAFEADFVDKKPTMYEYIQKLRRWRDKFEQKLDHRQSWAALDTYSHHLSEFKFLKFDESVEVPGQYQLHHDKNADFVRIERFMPTVDLVRGIGVCHRRLTMRGHDGSLHPFAVQHPAARHVRREERIVQLFRFFNGILSKRKESRRRNLGFHLPLLVPIAPHIRLVQDDESYITLQGIYEDHCRQTGVNKDDPILFTMEKLRTIYEANKASPKTPEQMSVMKTEIFTAIQAQWVPSTVALQYIQSIYASFESFWLFRKQVAYQLAAVTFMTYVMHMSNRYPTKLSISRASGNVWASELIPGLNQAKGAFFNHEVVPFRLTPNLQSLMGPLGIEGIFGPSIMAIARCLTEPSDGYELEQTLAVFVRDEMITWATANQAKVPHGGILADPAQMRELVGANVDFVVKRALSLAKIPEGHGGVTGVLPANQQVIDLISKAVNPANLGGMDPLWMGYL